MNKLLAQHPIREPNSRVTVDRVEASAAIEPEPVRLMLRKGQRSRNGDVPTVAAVVEIVNASDTRLKEYTCVLTVPAAALTFSSSVYVIEVKSDDTGWRSFRATEQNAGGAPIHPNETRQIMAIELGLEQLRLKETYLAGDYEGTLRADVIAEAWIEGVHYRQTIKVEDFFA